MTEPPSCEDFHAAPRLRWISLVVIPLVLRLAHDQPGTFFPIGICLIGFALVVAFVPRVSVTYEEIRMSRVFRLRWDDVRSAVVRNRWGRNFLFVERIRGRRWLIPLDPGNGRRLSRTILLKCPPGNPIHDALVSFLDTADFPAQPAGMPWKSVLLLVSIGSALSYAPYWVGTHMPLGPDAPELALLPVPLPIPPEEVTRELVPLTMYGLPVGVPCSVKDEPTRSASFSMVHCTNGNSVVIHDPRVTGALPWVGDSDANRNARDYLAQAAGSDDPRALMRAWLAVSPGDRSWFALPGTANTIHYLLEMKRLVLLGRRHVYELTGIAPGFQFGSPDHGERNIDVYLFGANAGPQRFEFVNCSACLPFTQADILAVAATLRAAPADELPH